MSTPQRYLVEMRNAERHEDVLMADGRVLPYRVAVEEDAAYVAVVVERVDDA